MYLKKSQELAILNYSKKIGFSPDLVNILRYEDLSPSTFKDKMTNLWGKLISIFSPDIFEATFITISDSDFFFMIKSEYLTKSDSNPYNIRFNYNPTKGNWDEGNQFKLENLSIPIWDVAFKEIKNWLDLTKIEFDSIKKIERLISIPDFIEFGQFEYNEKFSIEERKVLKAGIENLKNKITVEFDLTDYKLNLINRKLDQLSEKVDSNNKFDFKTAFVGLMINIASSVLYDNVGVFWNLVKGVFPRTVSEIKA